MIGRGGCVLTKPIYDSPSDFDYGREALRVHHFIVTRKVLLWHDRKNRFAVRVRPKTATDAEELGLNHSLLTKRVAFILKCLLTDTEVYKTDDEERTLQEYIEEAHATTQTLCQIALGHQINPDNTVITISSLTNLIRTLSMTLADSSTSTRCPIT